MDNQNQSYLENAFQTPPVGQPEELRIDNGETLNNIEGAVEKGVASYFEKLAAAEMGEKAAPAQTDKPEAEQAEEPEFHDDLIEPADEGAQAEVDLDFEQSAETAEDTYNRLRSGASDTLQQTALENMTFDELAALRDVCERKGYPSGVSHVSVNYALQAAAQREGGR